MFSELPKRTFSMEEVKPGEKLYEVCIILNDVRGAISKAAKVLADANVNIKTGALFYIPSKPEIGTWTSFVDISKATLSLQDLKEKLQSLDAVVDVRFEEPRPVPYEVIHFPVLHGDSRAIIMGTNTFAALWEGFEGILSPSGLEAVLYKVGKNIGTYTATGLKDTYDLENKDLISAIVQVARALGWGIIEFHDINFKSFTGTIIMKESFEALARQKKPYKVCHWTRGYFAGCMSIVFENPVEAVEVKCLATGAEYCEFKIKEKI